MKPPTGLLPTLTFTLTLLALGILLSAALQSPPIQGQAAAAGSAGATPTCLPAWAIVASPNPGVGGSALQGLAALSATNIWAVGSTYVPSLHVDQTLVEHWDGTNWSVVPSPNVGSSANVLQGVTAISPSDIWAVGRTGVDPTVVTLIEHWDGTSWSVVPSPNPGPDQNRLWAVAAAGPDDVWAVGDSGPSLEPQYVLILHWNGSAWLPSTAPNLPHIADGLRGIAVQSATDIWAVGLTCCLQGAYYTLTLHWDGTQWSVVPSAPADASNDVLNGVVAPASDNVWAVGNHLGEDQVRILHWDGTSWNAMAGPNPGTARNSLTTVTALGPDDIWAAGSTIGPSNEANTFIIHWDGTAWTQWPSPNVGPFFNELMGIVAAGQADVWAVGHSSTYAPVNPDQTLVEHYDALCAPPVTVTPAPSATATPFPATATALATPSHTPGAPAGSPTASPVVSPTPCAAGFVDVHAPDYFYTPVLYLACHGVISGYADGTFRPYNPTTRAQMVKIVVLGFGKPIGTPTAGGHTFADVAPDSPFFAVIETAAAGNIVSGYGCGGPGEPCDDQRRPYFRPSANVTRGQLSKIVVTAAGWTLQTPPIPTFADVPPGSAFYPFVETAVCHGVISGYADRTFHPGASATRDQIAKIVYLSLGAAMGCAGAP